MFKKFLAIIFVLGLLIVWLREYAIILIGILLLLVIVRWLADIFWWGRDKNKW